MVGAPDPLEQARRSLRRAHLHHKVDVSPVDAEVETGSGDQPRSLPRRHCSLDLAPRFHRKAAMVDADGQRLVVHGPQILEDQLGEAARVAEDERGLVLLDVPHDLTRGVAAGMARPGYAVLGNEDREIGLGTPISDDEVDQFHVRIGREP